MVATQLSNLPSHNLNTNWASLFYLYNHSWWQYRRPSFKLVHTLSCLQEIAVSQLMKTIPVEACWLLFFILQSCSCQPSYWHIMLFFWGTGWRKRQRLLQRRTQGWCKARVLVSYNNNNNNLFRKTQLKYLQWQGIKYKYIHILLIFYKEQVY